LDEVALDDFSVSDGFFGEQPKSDPSSNAGEAEVVTGAE
jgi:hypothetical protein